MKSLIAICLCVLAIPPLAQTNLQTFTSPDGAFQFKHSPALIHCTQGTFLNGEARWIEDSCLSQGDLCDDDSTKGTTIICLAYSNDKFKDKPAFIAAVFFVGLVPATTTQNSCLEGSQGWLIHDSQATKINGVSARLFHTSDAWMSGGESGKSTECFAETDATNWVFRKRTPAKEVMIRGHSRNTPPTTQPKFKPPCTSP
jgi:hypothetical protein